MTPRILALLIAVGLAQAALPQNATLLTTFNKPTPAEDDYFGFSVMALGNDKIIVGAYGDDTGARNAGSVFLFSTNGTLLTTFTNPTPSANDFFGHSVAAVGSDRIVIGADGDDTGAVDAGAAYLYSADGILLTTFTNPNPAFQELFGSSVAAVGSDTVLIGAYFDDLSVEDAGAAYLFSTNGTLLTTFPNPTPAVGDFFGSSLTAVGKDLVLIGAYGEHTGGLYSGAAYLFSTNGTLLTTITNPTPTSSSFDHFGESVAALGSDRVLVGAYANSAGALNAGAAFLFGTNGTLLSTFNNPTPAYQDFFGSTVTAVGGDMVLIGSPQDSMGPPRTGLAYLFSTNGTVLTTITNPTPADFDYFGGSVAALGSDRVLIGAHFDSSGGLYGGAAYLIALTPPTLTIASAAAGHTTISWMPNTPGFVLQETELLSPADWTNSLSGPENPTVALVAPPGRYFRLIKP